MRIKLRDLWLAIVALMLVASKTTHSTRKRTPFVNALRFGYQTLSSHMVGAVIGNRLGVDDIETPLMRPLEPLTGGWETWEWQIVAKKNDCKLTCNLFEKNERVVEGRDGREVPMEFTSCNLDLANVAAEKAEYPSLIKAPCGFKPVPKVVTIRIRSSSPTPKTSDHVWHTCTVVDVVQGFAAFLYRRFPANFESEGKASVFANCVSKGRDKNAISACMQTSRIAVEDAELQGVVDDLSYASEAKAGAFCNTSAYLNIATNEAKTHSATLRTLELKANDLPSTSTPADFQDPERQIFLFSGTESPEGEVVLRGQSRLYATTSIPCTGDCRIGAPPLP